MTTKSICINFTNRPKTGTIHTIKMKRDTSYINYNHVPLTVIGQHVAAVPETEWIPGEPADFEAEEVQAGGVDIIEMLLSFQIREIERMAGEFYRLPQQERSEG